MHMLLPIPALPRPTGSRAGYRPLGIPVRLQYQLVNKLVKLPVPKVTNLVTSLVTTASRQLLPSVRAIFGPNRFDRSAFRSGLRYV